MAGDYEGYEVEVLLRAGALLINDGYRAKNSELSNIGIPFARAGNIDGGFHFEDVDRVPEHTLAKVRLKRSLPGDVVFTSKGTLAVSRSFAKIPPSSFTLRSSAIGALAMFRVFTRAGFSTG
jgi:hypothetical protein